MVYCESMTRVLKPRQVLAKGFSRIGERQIVRILLVQVLLPSIRLTMTLWVTMQILQLESLS